MRPCFSLIFHCLFFHCISLTFTVFSLRSGVDLNSGDVYKQGLPQALSEQLVTVGQVKRSVPSPSKRACMERVIVITPPPYMPMH